ncbi:tyrosine-type recombinase/integrase [Bradyrhizobium sp. 143]|nr:tyrosine-type recombinase/integrase [Bradyrhizobium sp. 143]MCK1724365.1 tyrosine-type recombinase/integrase [Bradyrhizobium sp. 142]
MFPTRLHDRHAATCSCRCPRAAHGCRFDPGAAYHDLRASLDLFKAKAPFAVGVMTLAFQDYAIDRLLVHMRRWYDRKIIANHFVEWQGAGVKSVKNGFARAVEVAKLDLSDGNVTPHTLRHTAATWLMQLGTDPWEAAGFLGMSVKVLIDTYGHHHPDYMKEAAGAITKKRETVRARTLNLTRGLGPHMQNRHSEYASMERWLGSILAG